MAALLHRFAYSQYWAAVICQLSGLCMDVGVSSPVHTMQHLQKSKTIQNCRCHRYTAIGLQLILNQVMLLLLIMLLLVSPVTITTTITTLSTTTTSTTTVSDTTTSSTYTHHKPNNSKPTPTPTTTVKNSITTAAT